jgi:hypothetical protein
MKRFTVRILCVLLTFCVGIIVNRFVHCNSDLVNESWRTYVNEEHGYRLRYPERWKVWDRESLYLCFGWLRINTYHLSPIFLSAVLANVIKKPGFAFFLASSSLGESCRRLLPARVQALSRLV